MADVKQGIRELFAERYEFCAGMFRVDKLVREHAYFVLLTLLMNEGIAFSYDALAAYMPFTSSGSLLLMQWQQAILRWNFLKDLVDEANGLAIHRHKEGVLVAMEEVAVLEKLPFDGTFPSPEECPCPWNLPYWDRVGSRRRDFTKRHAQTRPLSGQFRILEFAFPLRLEYTFPDKPTRNHHIRPALEMSEIIPGRQADALPIGFEVERDELFLAQKNSDSPVKLDVRWSFTPAAVDTAFVQRKTLLTPSDLYRFLHAGLHDGGAPTLPEWNSLLGCYGHAGTAVLDILRNR